MMPDTSGNPVFEESLVIKVQNCRPHFFKPPGALNGDQYSVKDEGNHYLVAVTRWQDRKKTPRIPRVLQFDADVPITGIGFSECGDQIEEYKWKGPCGGCFFLRADLAETKNSAYVENWGHRRQHHQTYHFALWLENKRHGDDLDPQIYNEGEPPPTDGEDGQGKRKGILRLLKQLVTWWKR